MTHDYNWFTAGLEPSGRPGYFDCLLCGGTDTLHVEDLADGVRVKCFKCGAKTRDLARHLEANSNGGPAPVVITKVTAPRSSRSSSAGDPMEWWVRHTGVPEQVWTDAGVVVDGAHVVFTFPDIDAEKRRYEPTDEDSKGISWRGRLRPIMWPSPDETVGVEVHLTVSESDCGALLACGLEAYSLTKGDAGTNELFRAMKVLRERGAARVVVWTDADASGRKARDAIVDAVQAVGLPAIYPDIDALADPFTGEKDVNDLYRRLGVDGLLAAVEEALVDVPEPARTMTHAEMTDAANEEVEWDIPGLVSPGEKGVIAGPAKARKTWTVLDLIRSYRLCVPFLGNPYWTPAGARRVMYVGEEGVKQKFARRVALLGIPRNDDGMLWKHRTQFSLVSDARVSALIEELKAHRTEVLILDPFQRMSGGIEENSAKETGPVWDAIARVQGAIPRLTVWVVFHAGKDGDRAFTLDAIRGSSRHGGELDLALMMRKEDEEHSLISVEGRDLPSLAGGEAFKVHYDIDFDAGTLALTVVGVQAVKVTKVSANARRAQVQAALETYGAAGATADTVASIVPGVSPRQVGTYLNELVTAGSAAKVGKPSPGHPVTYVAITTVAPRNTDADTGSKDPGVSVVVPRVDQANADTERMHQNSRQRQRQRSPEPVVTGQRS